jgi:hypothetical protein
VVKLMYANQYRLCQPQCKPRISRIVIPWLALPLPILSRKLFILEEPIASWSIRKSPSCIEMGHWLVATVTLLAFLRIANCDELTAYSAFAEDISTPLANTTLSSPNLIRNVFARQNEWCTAGSPYVICPTPRTCCSASDNWQVIEM